MSQIDKLELGRSSRFTCQTPSSFLCVFLAALAVLGAVWPAALSAQVDRKTTITQTMAAGRVLFCVVDHDIIVAAVEGNAPGRRLPVVVPIGSSYLGVLLGAVQWDTPDETVKSVKLETNLARVAANASRHIANASPEGPNEIERIGIAVLELLRPYAERVHDKLDLAPDQPLFELLLADYVADYGPEIWSLQYRVRQESLGNDYWITRPQRPSYNQLYPPEKGQPPTLVEVQYPKSAEPGLRDRLARHDAALDAVGATSAPMAQAAAAIHDGTILKITAPPMANYLRAALLAMKGSSVAAGKAPVVMAMLEDLRGFQWLLPPADPLPVPTSTNPREQQPGAPTLRQYTPPE